MTGSGSGRRFAVRHRIGVDRESYRATLDTGAISTEVVIRFLPDGVGGRAARRLRDEIGVLASLRHHGVARVIDLVRLDGRLALVTEAVEGETLHRIVELGDRLPLRVALEVTSLVAEALHAATTTSTPGGMPMSLLHREVCPANVLLGQHGEVILTDFVVWSPPSGGGPTAAPEVRQGARHSTASDIFGLAATLYQGLTGQPLLSDLEGVDPTLRDRLLARLGSSELPADVLDLFADMSEVDPRERPSAFEVARRARDLAGRRDGAPLRRWALERAWSRPPMVPGPLGGRVLLEEPIEGAAAGPTDALVRAPLPTRPGAEDAPTVEEDMSMEHLGHFDELPVRRIDPPREAAPGEETEPGDPRAISAALAALVFEVEHTLPAFDDGDEVEDRVQQLVPEPRERPSAPPPRPAPEAPAAHPGAPPPGPAPSRPAPTEHRPPPSVAKGSLRRPRRRAAGTPLWAWVIGVSAAGAVAMTVAILAILVLGPVLQALSG